MCFSRHITQMRLKCNALFSLIRIIQGPYALIQGRVFKDTFLKLPFLTPWMGNKVEGLITSIHFVTFFYCLLGSSLFNMMKNGG